MVQQKLVFSEKSVNSNNGLNLDFDVKFDKLGNYIDIISGFPFKSESFVSEGVPVVKIKNVNPPIVDISNADYVSKDLQIDEKFILQKGDVVITLTGSHIHQFKSAVGLIGKVNFEGIAYLNQRLGKIVVTNEKIHNLDYFFHILSTDRIHYSLASGASGSANQANINFNMIKNLKVPILSSDMQNKMANFLTAIDKKIELLEKKQEAYQEFDFTIKNKIFNNYKDYSSIKLSKICTIKKGKQLNKSDMVENGEYYVLNGGKEPSGYTNSWNVKENTITISEGGNSCGFVSFNNEKFYCGGHCYYLTLENNDFDLKFLFYYLKYIEPKIMRLRVGSGLPNIQKGDIENINILKLDYNIQKEISNFLDSINKKISLNSKEKQKLEIFKKGLLQKMFV